MEPQSASFDFIDGISASGIQTSRGFCGSRLCDELNRLKFPADHLKLV